MANPKTDVSNVASMINFIVNMFSSTDRYFRIFISFISNSVAIAYKCPKATAAQSW